MTAVLEIEFVDLPAVGSHGDALIIAAVLCPDEEKRLIEKSDRETAIQTLRERFRFHYIILSSELAESVWKVVRL